MTRTELENEFTKYDKNETNLTEFLKKLPNEKERAFEEYIVKAIKLGKASIEDQLLEILKKCQADPKTDIRVFYNAFYFICTYYRRRKDTSKYGDMINQYKHLFCDNPTYSYLKAMYFMQRGREEEIREAIILSKKSIENVPNNVGIVHCYAEIIAEAFEESVLDIKNDVEELKQAMRLLQDVFKEDSNYAKFYCTYGRLLALSGNYKEAKQEILIAIDKEDSKSSDYSLRIGEYQRYLLQITSKHYADKASAEFENYNNKINNLNKEIKSSVAQSKEEVQNAIQGSLNKNLEFIGFFVALVSFIIASVQILTKCNFQDAFELIMELGGVILLILSGFSIIFNGNKYIKRSVVVFIMGIVNICLSLGIHRLIK